MSRVDTIDLELTVLMADGLAPKDTKLFGKQTEVLMCVLVRALMFLTRSCSVL